MNIGLERVLAFDVLNGLHSGIPVCCVLFFVREQITHGPFVARQVCDRRGESLHNGVNYVQCDRCYARRNVVDIRQNGRIGYALIKRELQEASRALRAARTD